MKLSKWSLAVAMSVVSMSAWAGDADFTLMNRTGFTIREIYVSPAKRSQWGKDRLGEGTLENAKSRHFKFGETAACRQDIKVVFEDESFEPVWENIDLCEIEKITLRYNRQSRAVSAEAE